MPLMKPPQLYVRAAPSRDTVHSTGCLGLSVLNSLGIWGGCEGDMPALLSMAILGSITGEDLFMCNPSRFDTKEGCATFAHCTLPVTMPDRFCLNTHFESGIGVAVQGSFDEGPCTLFKCSGDLTLPQKHASLRRLSPKCSAARRSASR